MAPVIAAADAAANGTVKPNPENQPSCAYVTFLGYSCLEVTVNSATDLKYGKILGKRRYYVIVSVSVPGGDSSHEQMQFTPVQKDDGNGLRWNHTMTFTIDEAATLKGTQKLKFKVKARKTISDDKEAGSIEVPVKTLLDLWHGAGRGGDGHEKPLETGYGLRLLPEEIKGCLQFSYKFRKGFTVAPYSLPAAIGYPAQQPAPQNGSGNSGLVPVLKIVDAATSVMDAATSVMDTTASIVDGMEM